KGSPSLLDKTIAAATAQFDEINKRFQSLEQDNKSRADSLAIKQEKTISDVSQIIAAVQAIIDAHKIASQKAIENRDGLDIVWDSCKKMHMDLNTLYKNSLAAHKSMQNEMALVKAWAEGNQGQIESLSASLRKDLQEKIVAACVETIDIEQAKWKKAYSADHDGVEKLVGK